MSSGSPAASATNNDQPEAQHGKCADAEDQSISSNKATVVGIYGVPGCGKSYILERLKRELGEKDFAFYEGSEKIGGLFPGGLSAFKQMDEHNQKQIRERAIDEIHAECVSTEKVAVVAGHLMFWTEGQRAAKHVYTQRDVETYTHILYLDAPASVVATRWNDDDIRDRGEVSTDHIQKWQQAEKSRLRYLCHMHGILFTVVTGPGPQQHVKALLLDFQRHSEHYNTAAAQRKLDEVISTGNDKIETVLFMDADKTLAASDAGELFGQKIRSSPLANLEQSPLKTLFSSSWGYSYAAFRQATLLYEAAADDEEFDALCQDVASDICLYQEFRLLLQKATTQEHIGVVVVTSGLRRVWQKVLEMADLSEMVSVIGGGRVTDGFVVTAEVKQALVSRLRDVHKKYVWAFGDGPLDLKMLNQAHQALVVVGEEEARSKTMDAALAKAIEEEGLSAQQILLPSSVAPRLDTDRLPITQLSEPAFTGSLLRRRSEHAHLDVILATEKPAAQLLATEMRDAAVGGPALREVHRRIGSYLANEYLGDAIGLEERPISHVLGFQAFGSQLASERKTTIAAMMRGGEPMAYGVNDVFPRAMFLHAKPPSDISFDHLKGQHNVLLVDSVINTGQSIVDFVEHVRRLHPIVRIVVIAGVVQAQAVTEQERNSLQQRLAHVTGVTVVGLRTSPTKFTGSGATDTGNRLFNTTSLR